MSDVAAGAGMRAVRAMSHIPKRATQHGVFLSGAEASITSLKPGQDQLHRQNFYLTEAKALQETYISQDQFKDSVYSKSISKLTLPEDYHEPARPIRPAATTGAYKSGFYAGTGHWKSEYDHKFHPDSLKGSKTHRQYGPPYEMLNPPTCVSQPNDLSFYQREFGVYGSNPRDRLRPGDTMLPKQKHELTVGTTKGTCHIPGYQGFLPTNTNNPKVAAIEAGESVRTVDKTNVTEIYHLNLPGYAGHVPSSACNDRGPRQISSMTVMGKDFSEVAGLDYGRRPNTTR